MHAKHPKKPMHSPPTETREPTSSNERWSVANRPRNLTKSRYSSGQRKRSVFATELFFLAEFLEPPFPGVGRGSAGAKKEAIAAAGEVKVARHGSVQREAPNQTQGRSASSRLRSGQIIYMCPRSSGSSLATISRRRQLSSNSRVTKGGLAIGTKKKRGTSIYRTDGHHDGRPAS